MENTVYELAHVLLLVHLMFIHTYVILTVIIQYMCCMFAINYIDEN